MPLAPARPSAARPPEGLRWNAGGLRWARWLPLLAVWLALVLLCGEWAARRETRVVADEAQRNLEVHALSLRGYAERFKHTPYTSSQHRDVPALLKARQGERSELVDRVDVYLNNINRRLDSDALYLLDASGTCIAASNYNEGPGRSFKGDNYNFRPYFKRAVRGELGVDYAVGTTTGLPGLFYATPVQVGDEILGVMVIKLALKAIENSLAQTASPVFVLDKRGIVILSTFPSYLYTASRSLGTDDLEDLLRTRQYGPGPAGQTRVFAPTPWQFSPAARPGYQIAALDILGQRKHFLVQQEDLTEFGWTLMVTTDLGSTQSARWIAITIAVLSSAVLLFAGLYWRHLGQSRRVLEARIQERTHDLAEAATFRKAMEDSLPVGMRARDLEGRIIYVNPAFCELTGYRNDELLWHMPPYPYWHPEDMEKHWRDNEATLSGQTSSAGFETRIRHRDGHDVHTMIYTAPLIDAAGRHSGWMSSLIDISAQKRAEEQQRIHVEQMQRTGRLASLGEMASTLAHELNQPLMAMECFASAAQAFAEQHRTALLMDNLASIRAQAQRAKDIVDRIRVPARQATAGFQDCHVHEVIANVLALMKYEIRQRKARVLKHLGDAVPPVVADQVLLEQVVMNLVLNGLQAMHANAPARRTLDLSTGTRGREVWIRVADQGPGIAPEVAARLFDSFFTTKPDGLGLGLKICRTIVEGHGGHLEFENAPGGGAVFTVFLPAKP